MEEHTEMIADISNTIMRHTTFYEDALQPGMKQVGNSLELVGKSINVALSPLAGLVWGYDQIEAWLKEKVAKRIQNVPLDEIQEPDVAIAVPTFESLRYLGEKRIISEMFVNLLASSMVRPLSSFAHPAFVEILRQMSGDEARMLNYFSGADEYKILTAYLKPKTLAVGTCLTRRFTDLPYKCKCDNPSQGSVYLDNLVRLGLLEYPPTVLWTGESSDEEFDEIRDLDEVKKFYREQCLDKFDLTREIVCVTAFGRDFLRVCAPAVALP